MSYILDALNRAEREGRGVSIADQAQTSSRASVVMIAVAVLLAANAGIFGWWILRSDEVAEPTLAAQAPTIAPDTHPADTVRQVQALPPPPTTTAPPSAPAAANISEGPPLTIAPAQTRPRIIQDETFIPAVTLDEIDQFDRSDFPDLNFTSHTYTSDPDSRFVHINGKSWHEGSRVADEVVLRTITEGGVEVSYRGYLITIGVLDDWQ